MKQQWQEWQDKINALNQRERILLLLTVLVAVVMLLQLLLIDPVLVSRKKNSDQLRVVTQQLQQQEGEKQVIAAQIAAGVNRHKEKRQQQLAAEVAELDNRIQQSIIAMIPPRLMPQVLESVLLQNKELKLISLENKPVVPLLEDTAESTGSEQSPVQRRKVAATTADEDKSAKKQGLYNHGFILRLSGNYMAAIRYFEELSKLPWQFYWDDLHYEVDNYPNATITLHVHTVSMSEDWIGV